MRSEIPDLCDSADLLPLWNYLAHLNKTYGVALGWTNQRIERGELDLLGEDTKDMMADPLTKVMPATVLEERGVLGRHLGNL